MIIVKKIEDILKQPEADLIVNCIVDRYRKGLYSLVLTTGLPGTGKSSLDFRIAELVTLKFQNKGVVNKVIDSLFDLAKLAMEAREDEVNIGIIEEVSVLFPSRRAMSGDNVDLAKLLDTCRKKKIILLANAPLWPTIDSHMRAMGTLYIETLRVYKKIGIVISKFFRLQTNPKSGKTYQHTMLRNGAEVKRMYTRKPNTEVWKAYEIKKDLFMQKLYVKIQARATKREEKEAKELGILKPLTNESLRHATQKEIEAYHNVVSQGKTMSQYASEIGVSKQTISARIKSFKEKTNVVDADTININSDFNSLYSKNNNSVSIDTTIQGGNNIKLVECLEENNNKGEEGVKQ